MSKLSLRVSSLTLALSTGYSLLFSVPALAHGAPEYPISRQYQCYKNRAQPACAAAVAFGGEQALYDWNGVNQGAAAGNHRAVVPDGGLCAGGQAKFKGFDLARRDWQPTVWSPGTDGSYEFRYHATAPHRTSEWQFYLTRDGWDPALRALRWEDLDLAVTKGPSEMDTSVPKQYTMRLQLPQRTGKHVLFAIWQRVDSSEAFYSCSDVDFGGGKESAGHVPKPAAATTLSPLGQVTAHQDLPPQASVTLRVFGAAGSDLESLKLTITASNGAKAVWLRQLAQLVNARSSVVRLGDVQGDSITVPSGMTSMQVYALPGHDGIQHAVDISLPATEGSQGPAQAAAPTWIEGGSYKTGQIVSHNGQRYVCLQAHTAYVGAGWLPDAPSVLNVLWKRQ